MTEPAGSSETHGTHSASNPMSQASPTKISAENAALVAVITAAIHAAIEAPAKILSIRQVHPGQSPETARMAWALEGRRHIFASHKLR